MAATPIVHIEWKSADFGRTAAFYARVFDWRTEQNASASYMKLDGGDGPSGGWLRADFAQSPGPVAYLAVDDVAAKLQEIEEAGGRILVRSLPFAGGGEVALFADPDGNVLGLWRRKTGAGSVATTASGASDKAAADASTENGKGNRPAATKAPSKAISKPANKPKKRK